MGRRVRQRQQAVGRHRGALVHVQLLTAAAATIGRRHGHVHHGRHIVVASSRTQETRGRGRLCRREDDAGLIGQAQLGAERRLVRTWTTTERRRPITHAGILCRRLRAALGLDALGERLRLEQNRADTWRRLRLRRRTFLLRLKLDRRRRCGVDDNEGTTGSKGRLGQRRGDAATTDANDAGERHRREGASRCGSVGVRWRRRWRGAVIDDRGREDGQRDTMLGGGVGSISSALVRVPRWSRRRGLRWSRRR